MLIFGKVPAVLVGLLLAITMISDCAAAPGSVNLSSDEHFSIHTIKGNVTCGLVNGIFVPGQMAADGATFTSFTVLIRALKLALQSATGKKKDKLRTKIGKLQSKRSVAKSECLDGPDSADPSNTPTANPTARPTSTPSQQGCFDSQGNTSKFGIPSGIQGNISRGQTAWSAPRSPNSCAGCHLEASKRNSSFSKVNGAFGKPEMSSVVKPANQELSDIVAYLNRFNTVCP